MNFVLVLFAVQPLQELAMQAGFEASNSFMIWGALLEGAII